MKQYILFILSLFSVTLPLNLLAQPTTTTAVSYCQGAISSPLVAVPTTVSDTLKWYDAGLTLLGSAPVPSTSTTGTTTYYVSEKSAVGIESSKVTITITIKPTPASPTTSTFVNVCQAVIPPALSATLASPTDTLKWYDSGPTKLPSAPVPSTATPGVDFYYVSEKNSAGCESPKVLITVFVNPYPTTPLTTTMIEYCKDDTATVLVALARPIDTLKWYNSAMVLLPGAPTPSTSVPGVVNYYVSTKITEGCEGDKRLIMVHTWTLPSRPVITTPLNLCKGIPTTELTALGTNLKWYDVATGGTELATPIIPSTNTAGTTTYYVTQTTALHGCTSLRAPLVVNVKAGPATTIAPIGKTDLVFCANDSIGLKATAAGAVSFQWFRDDVLSAGATFDTISVSNPSKLSVIAKDADGCADTTAVNVIKNPLPAPTLSPSDTFLCNGFNSLLTVKTTTPALKYLWYKNGIDMQADTTKSSMTIPVSGTYNVLVTDKYKCVVNTNTANVTIRPPLFKPSIIQYKDTLRLNNTYKSYQWFRNDTIISGATASLYIRTMEGKYWVRVMDVYGCDTYSDTITLGPVIKDTVVVTQGIKLYPNPTLNKINIKSDKTVNLKVTDMTGKTLMTQDNATEVELGNLPDGLYLFYILDADNKKLMIEKVLKRSAP